MILTQDVRELKAVEGEKGFSQNYDFKKALSDFESSQRISKTTRAAIVPSLWSESKQSIKRWKNARSLVQLGDVQMLRGKYERALSHFQAAFKLDENLIQACLKAIFCATFLKKLDAVEELYEQALRVTNNRLDLLHERVIFRLGHPSILKEKYQETVEDVNYILLHEPTNSAATNTLGFIQLNFENNVQKAKSLFEKAIQLDARNIYALNNLGVCFVRLELYEKAIEWLRKAVSIDLRYKDAYQNLSSVFLKKGQIKDALNVLQEATSSKVALDESFQHNIGWFLLLLNDFKSAITWYEDRILLEPNNYLLYTNLGFSYFKLGNLVVAENLFQKAIHLIKYSIRRTKAYDSRGLFAFYNLGRLALQVEDQELLDETAKDLSEIRGNDPFFFYFRACWYSMRGEFEEASRYFKESLKISSDVPDVYPDYTFVLTVVESEYEEAVKLLLLAKTKGIQSPLIDNNLAYALIQLGRLDEAKKIIDLYSDFPTITATKGLYCIKLGKLDEARELYSKAKLSLVPKFQLVAEYSFLLESAIYLFKEGNKLRAKELIAELEKLPTVPAYSRKISSFKKQLFK